MDTENKQPQNDGKDAEKPEAGKSVEKGDGRTRAMEPRTERQGTEGRSRENRDRHHRGHVVEEGLELIGHQDGSRNRNRPERNRDVNDHPDPQLRTNVSIKREPGVERPRDNGISQRPERGGREKGQRSERGQREAVTLMDANVTERPVQERTEKQGMPERNSKHENNERNRTQGKTMIEVPRIPKKREESAEDIRIVTESVEKDIQFEIKQIQTIKLGM